MLVRHPFALAAIAAPLVVGAATAFIPKDYDTQRGFQSWMHRAELGAVAGTAALALVGRGSWRSIAKVAGIAGATFVAGAAANAWHERQRDLELLRPDYRRAPGPNPPLTGVDPKGAAEPGDLSLGKDFLIGTTNSATQVEGGGIDNDISRWAETHDGWAAPNPGLDHWNRVEVDNQHLQDNGHDAHGLTIDWARIEPREGEFDEAAIQHYRDEIESLRRHGMEPIVTLMQYALPPWLAEEGGVLSPRAPELFAEFSRKMGEELGDDVTWWKTMNEPNTLAAAGYLAGVWAPGEQSPTAMMDALEGQLRMHAASATALHEVAKEHHREAKVGIAYIDDKEYPAQWWNPADQVATRAYDYVGNRWFLDSIKAGKALRPVGDGEEIPGLKDSLDYVGLNFYGREWGHVDLSAGKDGMPLVGVHNPERDGKDPVTDADGLYERTMAMWNQFHLPIVISENGVDIAGDDPGNLRGRAIVDSLSALHHAQADGADVVGYLHWTDWDSPEWHDGWSQHYGIFGFDPETGRRWDKPAAATFEAIARRHAVPHEWLSDDNRESPAKRDPHAAHELRVLREHDASND